MASGLAQLRKPATRRILGKRSSAIGGSGAYSVGEGQLTLSGNEINDVNRGWGFQGDGLLDDSSFGLYDGTTNLVANGGFESSTTGWTCNNGLIARSAADSKFGIACGQWSVGNPASSDECWHGGTISGATTGRIFSGSIWINGTLASIGKTVRLVMREKGGASGAGVMAIAEYTLTSDWQRASVTGTVVENDRTQVSIGLVIGATGTPLAAGNNVLLDGAQVEERRLATPYVETNGFTASRSGGFMSFPVAGVLDETQSWVACRVRIPWSASLPHTATPRVWYWGVDGNNRIGIYLQVGQVICHRIAGGSSTGVTKAFTWAAGDLLTIVCAWSSAGMQLSINGGPFQTTGSVVVPDLSSQPTSYIGAYLDGTQLGVLDFKWFACGTGVLTDADAVAIHCRQVVSTLVEGSTGNGNLETLDGPNDWTDWIEDATPGSTVTSDAGYSGDYSCKLTGDASNNYVALRQALATIGKSYRYSFMTKCSAAGKWLYAYFNANAVAIALTTDWTRVTGALVADGTVFGIKRNLLASASAWIDDVVIQEVNPDADTSLESFPGEPMLYWSATATPAFVANALTLSGNEITDAVRTANVQGDGRAAESSMGIWPGTTNLCTNGGLETNTTGWASWNHTGSASISRTTAEAKFGAASLQTDVSGVTGTPGNRQTTSLALATQHTVSWWLKGPSGKSLTLQVYGNSLGTLIASASLTFDGTWQRKSITFTSHASGAVHDFFTLRHGADAGLAYSYYTDGFQIETQPIVTPYVETDGGTAARGASKVSIPRGTLVAHYQGWFALRVSPSWAAGDSLGAGVDPRLASIRSFSGYPDAIELYGAGTVNWAMKKQGSSGPTVAMAHAKDADLTIIGTWEPTTAKISLNGAAFVSAGATTNPDPAKLDSVIGIGNWDKNPTPSSLFRGRIRWFAFGQGTLSDADAATIHAFGNTDPAPSAFPASALVRGVWPALTSAYSGYTIQSAFEKRI